MIKGKQKFVLASFETEELGARNLMHQKGHSQNTPEPELTGDAKILYEAYKTFSENGLTADEKTKLEKIDEVLKDASIQLLKNGGAVITDNTGKAMRVK